jgi:hypothetical protein
MNGLLTLSDGRKLQWADNDVQSNQALVLFTIAIECRNLIIDAAIKDLQII